MLITGPPGKSQPYILSEPLLTLWPDSGKEKRSGPRTTTSFQKGVGMTIVVSNGNRGHWKERATDLKGRGESARRWQERNRVGGGVFREPTTKSKQGPSKSSSLPKGI